MMMMGMPAGGGMDRLMQASNVTEMTEDEREQYRHLPPAVQRRIARCRARYLQLSGLDVETYAAYKARYRRRQHMRVSRFRFFGREVQRCFDQSMMRGGRLTVRIKEAANLPPSDRQIYAVVTCQNLRGKTEKSKPILAPDRQ
jgi:hypothetical protein